MFHGSDLHRTVYHSRFGRWVRANRVKTTIAFVAIEGALCALVIYVIWTML